MYDELVKSLRICADGEHCDRCEKWDIKQDGGRNACEYALCTEAADAIEELSMPRWIPVTEMLPESMHEYVLCCGEKGGQFVGWVGEGMIVNGKARAFQHGGRGRYITHWMPLPEPPKGET